MNVNQIKTFQINVQYVLDGLAQLRKEIRVKNKMVNAKRIFLCAHCKCEHETYEEASECCTPEEVWGCGKCLMSWEQDKEGAESCCSQKKENKGER